MFVHAFLPQKMMMADERSKKVLVHRLVHRKFLSKAQNRFFNPILVVSVVCPLLSSAREIPMRSLGLSCRPCVVVIFS